MKMFRRFLTALAALGTLVLASPAHAEALQPGHAPGLCLDFSTGEGALFTCNGGRGQDIKFPRNGVGPLKVGGSCIADVGQGQPLTLTQCRNRVEQTWQIAQGGALMSGTRLCADSEGGGKREGTRVIAFRCNGGKNQSWSLAGNSYPGGNNGGPSGGSYQTALLTPRHAPGMCLDVRGGNSDLIIYGCHGKTNQQFSFTTYGETELQVGGNCVTAPNSSGQSLYVARCTGSYQQRWSFANDGTIRSASGYCADVNGASRQQETSVILYKCSGKTNQRWDAIVR